MALEPTITAAYADKYQGNQDTCRRNHPSFYDAREEAHQGDPPTVPILSSDFCGFAEAAYPHTSGQNCENFHQKVNFSPLIASSSVV